MNLAQTLRRWQTLFYVSAGEPPKFMPMTSEELGILRNPPDLNEVGYYTGARLSAPHVFGTDVFESPFGEQMRDRQVKMPVEQVCITDKSSVSLNYKLDKWEDEQLNILHRRLTAHVCKDTTKLSATFEWDPFASFKRALRITKWWPVRTRTVEIEGKVLYPYLNITFPLNKHHVTLAVQS